MSLLADPLDLLPGPHAASLVASAYRRPTLLVVEDTPRLATALGELCAFLRVAVERVRRPDDLPRLLRERNPMAVLAELDGGAQDGCHVMMRIAEHDTALPILLLTGPDPALAGAADAVRELWALSAVELHANLPGIGALADFLCRAGRGGGCLGLLAA